MSNKIGDFLPDDETPQEKKERELFIKRLPLILKYFGLKDQRIIRMRFGLGDGVGHTLEEVGLKYKVTRKYIRQIEAKIFKKLNTI